MKSTTRTIAIDEIIIDADTQPRAIMNTMTVQEYRDEMLDGVKFPPIEVFTDGASYWLVDGFHRRWAAMQAEIDELECIVYEGTLADAQWYSYARNSDHGLRRTNADKRKAVMRALKHAKGVKMSDGDISEHCGVSQPFVSKLRRELQSTHNGFESATRKGRDGRTINTANIGKKKAEPVEEPETVDVYECDGQCHECVEDCDQRECDYIDEDGTLEDSVEAKEDSRSDPNAWRLCLREVINEVIETDGVASFQVAAELDEIATELRERAN